MFKLQHPPDSQRRGHVRWMQHCLMIVSDGVGVFTIHQRGHVSTGELQVFQSWMSCVV